MTKATSTAAGAGARSKVPSSSAPCTTPFASPSRSSPVASRRRSSASSTPAALNPRLAAIRPMERTRRRSRPRAFAARTRSAARRARSARNRPPARSAPRPKRHRYRGAPGCRASARRSGCRGRCGWGARDRRRRPDRRWCERTVPARRPSPVQSNSTATKGASSTSIRPRSAGVSSQNEPSASRFSTLANRQTNSLRPIGLPRYSQVPSRWMTKGRSPHSAGARRARPGFIPGRPLGMTEALASGDGEMASFTSPSPWTSKLPFPPVI